MRVLLIISILFCNLVHGAGGAEEEEKSNTIFSYFSGKEEVRHSGFVTSTLKFREIGSLGATLLGLRFAWLVDEVFFVGGGGQSLVSKYFAHNTDEILDVTYGGIFTGAYIFPSMLLHGVILFNYGWGELSTKRVRESVSLSQERFNIFEPEFLLELNLSRFFRFAAGISYSFVGGVEAGKFLAKSSDLNKPTLTLALSLGGF